VSSLLHKSVSQQFVEFWQRLVSKQPLIIVLLILFSNAIDCEIHELDNSQTIKNNFNILTEQENFWSVGQYIYDSNSIPMPE